MNWNSWSADAHDKKKKQQQQQQQENGTADRWENNLSPEQWNSEERNAPITADLRDINGAA